VNLYKGEVSGKGNLPNGENLSIEDIQCSGCLSGNHFMHCRQCDIRACTKEKGHTGCHECDEFPCQHIENFPMAVGKKVILRLSRTCVRSVLKNGSKMKKTAICVLNAVTKFSGVL
jgi:hypothetical protein